MLTVQRNIQNVIAVKQVYKKWQTSVIIRES